MMITDQDRDYRGQRAGQPRHPPGRDRAARRDSLRGAVGRTAVRGDLGYRLRAAGAARARAHDHAHECGEHLPIPIPSRPYWL